MLLNKNKNKLMSCVILLRIVGTYCFGSWTEQYQRSRTLSYVTANGRALLKQPNPSFQVYGQRHATRLTTNRTRGKLEYSDSCVACKKKIPLWISTAHRDIGDATAPKQSAIIYNREPQYFHVSVVLAMFILYTFPPRLCARFVSSFVVTVAGC